MERVGIAFGCFIPFHAGHQRMIDVALNENDKLLLGVCGKDTDRGQAYIPFKDRQKLIQEKFGDDPDITISVVDDDKIGLTGKFDVEAWKTWADEFFINAKILGTRRMPVTSRFYNRFFRFTDLCSSNETRFPVQK